MQCLLLGRQVLLVVVGAIGHARADVLDQSVERRCDLVGLMPQQRQLLFAVDGQRGSALGDALNAVDVGGNAIDGVEVLGSQGLLTQLAGGFGQVFLIPTRGWQPVAVTSLEDLIHGVEVVAELALQVVDLFERQ